MARGASGPSRATIVILVLASITLITLDFRGDGGVLSSVRDGVADVTSPIRDFVGRLTDPIEDAWNGAFGYDELEAENEELRNQLEELEASTLLRADERRELEQLRALHDLTDPLDLESVSGRVIDAAVSDFERTVEIDVGLDAGVRVGMPVVGPGGLVGRVADASASRSQVVLLTDDEFGVAVRMARTGSAGVATGQGRSAPLRIQLLDPRTAVIPGETVTTSGLDGSDFPAGLLVGTVLDARFDEIDGVLEVNVIPAADLDRLSVVSVLRFRPAGIDDEQVINDGDTILPATTVPEVIDPAFPFGTGPPTTAAPVPVEEDDE